MPVLGWKQETCATTVRGACHRHASVMPLWFCRGAIWWGIDQQPHGDRERRQDTVQARQFPGLCTQPAWLILPLISAKVAFCYVWVPRKQLSCQVHLLLSWKPVSGIYSLIYRDSPHSQHSVPHSQHSVPHSQQCPPLTTQCQHIYCSTPPPSTYTSRIHPSSIPFITQSC